MNGIVRIRKPKLGKDGSARSDLGFGFQAHAGIADVVYHSFWESLFLAAFNNRSRSGDAHGMAVGRSPFLNNQAVGNFQSVFDRRRRTWFLQNEVNSLAGDLPQGTRVIRESDYDAPITAAIYARLLEHLGSARQTLVEHQQVKF